MSGKDNNNTPGTLRDVQNPFDTMSAPTSPTDIRHPLSRVESASDQRPQESEGLSESFQSTDTIRRRPEPQSYGMQQRHPYGGYSGAAVLHNFIQFQD